MRFVSKGSLLSLLVLLQACAPSLQNPDHILQKRQLAIGSLGTPVSNPQWRAGHAAVVIGDYMVIWGGVASLSPNPYDANSTNDVFVFSLVDHVWYSPNVTAGPGAITPTPQKFHSAWVYNSTQIIYLISTTFQSSNTTRCCDGAGRQTIVLDTTSWSWLRGMWDDLDGYFGNTFGVAAASFGGARLMVQGGLVFDGVGSDPQFPMQNSWLYANPDNPQAGWKQYGDPVALSLGLDDFFNPTYSVYASLCYLESANSLILFGGATNDGNNSIGQATNQLAVLQVPYNLTDSEVWDGFPSRNQSAVTGTIPYLRQSHTANCFSDKMIVFGGGDESLTPTDGSVYILRSTNNTYLWSASGTSNSPFSPGPRMGHSAVSWGDTIVIFGGWGPSNITDNKVYAFTFTGSGDVNWTIYDIYTPPTYTPPNNTQLNYTQSEQNWTLSDGDIAAAVVCPVIASLVVGLIVWFCFCRRKPHQVTEGEKTYAPPRLQSPPPMYSDPVNQQEFSAIRNLQRTIDNQQDLIHTELSDHRSSAAIVDMVAGEFDTQNRSPY